MMGKQCDECRRSMSLTDYMPDDDEFDMELAIECGLTPDEERLAETAFEGKWARFRYVQQLWECDFCQYYEWHVDGPRYYWNPTSGEYDCSKPLTPKERYRQQRERQEAAGQLRMFDDSEATS